MVKETVGAKLSSMEESLKITFDMPENVKEAIDHHTAQGLNGEDIVFSRYKASLIIDLQAFMRSHMKGDDAVTTSDALQALVDEWKPGTKAKGKSPAEKVRDLFGRLSAEEREEVLAELGLA